MSKMKEIDIVIQEMKQWCLDNYKNGADVMVECWSTDDYFQLILSCYDRDREYEPAWEALKDIAAIYRDEQADAAYHRSMAR